MNDLAQVHTAICVGNVRTVQQQAKQELHWVQASCQLIHCRHQAISAYTLQVSAATAAVLYYYNIAHELQLVVLISSHCSAAPCYYKLVEGRPLRTAMLNVP